MERLSYFRLSELSLDELIPLAQADCSNNSRPMNEVVRRFTARSQAIATRVCHHKFDRIDVANVALAAVPGATRIYRPSSGKPYVGYIMIAMLNDARRESIRLAGQRIMPNAIDAVERARAKYLTFDADVVEREALPFGWLAPFVEQLPSAEREVILLSDRGYKGTEIAGLRGVQAPAISKRLSSAYKLIRQHIEAAA